MKFVVRTDCHLSDKTPTSRQDDYLNTCLDKLRQIGQIAREEKAIAVLDNGDFFDSTTAKNNSHSMVRKVVELHEDYPCPVYENPGNHDFPYKNLKYINRMPLGVLFAAGVYKRMDDITFEGENGLTVRVVGLPYRSKFTVHDWDIERGDEDVLICAAHAYASKNGGPIFNGNDVAMSYHDLSECSPDFFIFGHWHIDQGIEKVNGKYFMNLGSMTRGSLVQDNLKRIPRVGVVEVTKDEFGVIDIEPKAVELEVEPSDEVFDLEKHERLEKEQRDIDQFVSSLKSASSEDEDDLFEVVESMTEFQDEVKSTALRYLKQAAKED